MNNIDVESLPDKISFIGAGNMARSIIGGLINQGLAASQILACDPFEENRNNIQTEFGVDTSADNTEATKASVIVLAVKPQVMKQVCEGLAGKIDPNTLIITIAAGITCDSLSAWLQQDLPIVRCMPNTPALVQEGASALFANALVNEAQKTIANAALGAVGTIDWVDDEALMDTVTALSGSGPAYFFMVFEGMIASAVKQGLSPESARALAVQTALGSAKLASTSSEDIAELRRRVTSPGGTTERAIQCFEENDLRQIIDKAMQAAADRSRELATQFDD